MFQEIFQNVGGILDKILKSSHSGETWLEELTKMGIEIKFLGKYFCKYSCQRIFQYFGRIFKSIKKYGMQSRRGWRSGAQLVSKSELFVDSFF